MKITKKLTAIGAIGAILTAVYMNRYPTYHINDTTVVQKLHMFTESYFNRMPNLVILHHTAGATIRGAEATLRQRGLGYHYMIDKDGTVYEYAKPNTKLYHAYGYNPRSIGVSFVCGGKYGAVNEKQMHALDNLLPYLKKKYPYLRYVTGHKHADPRGWKIDPRWPGEPENGIDKKIDDKYMRRVARDSGLKYIKFN